MVIHWKWRVIPAYTLMMFAICLIVWVFLHIAAKEPNIENEIVVPRALPLGPTARRAVHKVMAKSPPIHNGGNDTVIKREEGDKEGNPRDEVTIPVNIPLEGSLTIPNNTILRSMSWRDLSILYHRYISQTQFKCEDISRIGRVTDGGWDFCNDAYYRPTQPCVVYSFGIDDDFSFDDAMIRTYGCKVHSFDPSMSMQSQKRKDYSFFYKQGLADSDRTLPNGWVMSRMETIVTSLKHTKTEIHTMKFDIEEWEWEVLPDLLVHNSLKTVTQLLMELHQCDGCSKYDPQQEDKEPSKERYIHMLGLLRQLYELNFRIFHHHHNKACLYLSKFTLEQISACTDLSFVKVS